MPLPRVNFKGNKSASVDFGPVRDGRMSRPFYQDIDLSVARSVAAGNPLILNMAGNSFYQDQEATDGKIRVHFQDTNFDITAAPLTSTPGTIFYIPFTQILIENAAQPGKKARIVYGVDLDFQPNTTSQVTIAGAVAINDTPSSATQFLKQVATGAGSVTTLLAAATNVNGATLRSIHLSSSAGSVNPNSSFAFASPTSAGFDSSNRAQTLMLAFANPIANQAQYSQVMNEARFIPAGWGIFVYNSDATGSTVVYASLDLS